MKRDAAKGWVLLLAGGVLCGPVPPGADSAGLWRLLPAPGRGQPAGQPANSARGVAGWGHRHNSLKNKILAALLLGQPASLPGP